MSKRIDVQANLLDLEKQKNLKITIKKEIEAQYNDWLQITITMLKDYDEEYCFYDDFENDSDKITEYIYNLVTDPFEQMLLGFIFNLEKGSNLSQMQIFEMVKENVSKELYAHLNSICSTREKRSRAAREDNLAQGGVSLNDIIKEKKELADKFGIIEWYKNKPYYIQLNQRSYYLVLATGNKLTKKEQVKKQELLTRLKHDVNTGIQQGTLKEFSSPWIDEEKKSRALREE